MTTAYDGINSLAPGIARQFPDAWGVMGYLNGTFAWSQSDWNLFPHSKKIEITVTASYNGGDVLDVETGDATPAQTEAWIAMRKAAGYFRPTIYCNLSTVPAVRQGTGKFKLGVDYDLWVAVYDGSTSSPYAGAVAKQYESTADYDLNEVYDVNWPYRVAPSPKPETPTGFSETATETYTDFGWAAQSDATSYDFQLVQGNKQVARESTKTPSVEKVTTSPGQAYAWHVAAVNGYGASAWSELRTFTTPGVGFKAPTGLRVEAGIISVSWDTVADVAGKSPTGYTVDVLFNGQVTKTQTVKGTTAVVDSLVRGQVYEIVVTAEGGQGTPESAKIAVTA